MGLLLVLFIFAVYISTPLFSSSISVSACFRGSTHDKKKATHSSRKDKFDSEGDDISIIYIQC